MTTMIAAMQNSRPNGPTSVYAPSFTADEVATAILYLASDAAAFINGVALPIDGGGIAGY